MGKRLRTPFVASVVASILIALGLIGVRHSGNMEALELAAYDWLIRLRPQITAPNSRIVLIGITEGDLQHQQHWPLRDDSLAQILERLLQYQPRAIGVDIYRDIPVPPGREQLEAVLTTHPHIIVPTKVGEGPAARIAPPSVLQHSEQVGFNDILVDPGGVVRRGLLFLDDDEASVYSFALRLALLYLQAEGIQPEPDALHPEHLRLGRTTLRPFAASDGGYVRADARGYQFLLDFAETSAVFPVFSLADLLAGTIDPSAITGKIVVLGTTAESVKDLFYTPHSRGLEADRQMLGVVLHAHMISQLLRAALDGNAMIITSREASEWGWILVWGIMGGVAGFWVRSPWRFSLLAVAGLMCLGLLAYGAFLWGWWVPLVPPALAWAICAAFVTAYMSNQEKRQRAFLMQLFARHVSPQIAEAIWQQREQFLHQGRPRSQRLVASVLFTDMVGFTTVSETFDPQMLVEWVSDYLEAMAPHVIAHEGVILRFLGDAIMAAFGVPLARSTVAEISQDATNAVRCALAMEQTLIALNQRWSAQQRPLIGMRIGIFTGPVVAGSLGSTQRLEYNILGDTVNTASRLESFEKQDFLPDFLQHPCRIFIGETTRQYLGTQFLTQSLGEVSLKGKAQKITVYRVLGCTDGNLSGVMQGEKA